MVRKDSLEINVSPSPLMDSITPRKYVQKEVFKPLEVFSVDPWDLETMAISSVRNSNVSILNPRKKS